MDNEWSMDFAFPLISLLRTNKSQKIITKKIIDICEYVLFRFNIKNKI